MPHPINMLNTVTVIWLNMNTKIVDRILKLSCAFDLQLIEILENDAMMQSFKKSNHYYYASNMIRVRDTNFQKAKVKRPIGLSCCLEGLYRERLRDP